MKIALIQFNAGSDKAANLRKAERFVLEAAKRGAQFVLLPEVFVYRGESGANAIRLVADDVEGETLKPLRRMAAENKIYILAGSIWERVAGRQKIYNTSTLIGPSGKTRATYRKIHLFEARLDQLGIRESNTFLPGKTPVMSRVEGFKIGLSICYDLRFPELYLNYGLRGADILCVPSAFTHETGKAHWETLLRSRAIENLCYVLAPNQVGLDGKGVRHHGHSMVIDPWGRIIAEGPVDREGVITAEIHHKDLEDARRRLPGIRKRIIKKFC